VKIAKSRHQITGQKTIIQSIKLHLAVMTIITCSARFSSVKFCRRDHILSQYVTKHTEFGSRDMKCKYLCAKVTINFNLCWLKIKYSCKNNCSILAKTRHIGKITGFMAFDENHGFREFGVSIFYCPYRYLHVHSRWKVTSKLVGVSTSKISLVHLLSIDWLIDWLIACLLDCLLDWLIDCYNREVVILVVKLHTRCPVLIVSQAVDGQTSEAEAPPPDRLLGPVVVEAVLLAVVAARSDGANHLGIVYDYDYGWQRSVVVIIS